MFKRKRKRNTEELKFKTENYSMKESYSSSELVVANLQYVSSAYTPNGPMVETTKQKYMFEVIQEGELTRYREVFTGFIADTDSQYFDLPYVVNIKPLSEEVPTVAQTLPRYGMLLLLNEINTPKKVKVKVVKTNKEK